jgi:hypothetical protein
MSKRPSILEQKMGKITIHELPEELEPTLSDLLVLDAERDDYWYTKKVTLENFMDFLGSSYFEPAISQGTPDQYWRGDKSWRTLKQSVVDDLMETDSPAFVSIRLSALTDGYFPYHASDVAGLVNSPLYTDGTNIGIGMTPSAKLDVDGFIRSLGYPRVPTSGAGLEVSYNPTASRGYLTAADRTNSLYKELSINGLILTLNSYSGGNVLVGTNTDLGYKLNVNGTGYFATSLATPTIKLSTGAAANFFWMSTGIDGSGAWTAIAASQVYKGIWLASTNTPTLADGTGTVGWYYRAVDAGTVDFGHGGIAFVAGDDCYYSGTLWQKIPGIGYTLQTATASVLGGIKVGGSLQIDAGTGILNINNADMGDITVSGTGSDIGKIWTIDNNVVTFAKFQQIATASLLGRATSGIGNVENLTDIPTGITIGSQYIYRVGGTDVSIADGGTGASSLAAGYLPYSSGGTAYAASPIFTDGTNLGIGVVPKAWDSLTGMEIGGSGSGISGNLGGFYLGTGFYYATGWKYAIADIAIGKYQISLGAHTWSIAPPGIVGNAISWTDALTLNANGYFGVNTITPRRRVDILYASAPQLRLTQTDNSVYTDFQTDSSGNLILTPTGGIVKTTGIQVKTPWCDVRLFAGGHFNGTENDAPAIEAAITAGYKRLFLPNLTLWIPTANSIAADLEIIGESWTGVVIKASNPATEYISIGARTILHAVSIFDKSGVDQGLSPNVARPVRWYANNRASSYPVTSWFNQNMVIETGETGYDRPAFGVNNYGIGDAFWAGVKGDYGIGYRVDVGPSPNEAVPNAIGHYIINWGQGRGIFAVGKAGSTGVIAQISAEANVQSLNLYDISSTTQSTFQSISFGKTSGNIFNIYHQNSAMTGHAFIMNMGNNGGSFTGYFWDLKVAGVSKFVIEADGHLYTASSTVVANLNADLWDGYQFASYLDQAVKQASSPTFAGGFLTNNLLFNNNIGVRGKTTGGVSIQLAGMGSDDKVYLGADAPTDILIGTGAGSTNPIYIKVGGAQKNVQIDANGFLKGA